MVPSQPPRFKVVLERSDPFCCISRVSVACFAPTGRPHDFLAVWLVPCSNPGIWHLSRAVDSSLPSLFGHELWNRSRLFKRHLERQPAEIGGFLEEKGQVEIGIEASPRVKACGADYAWSPKELLGLLD